MCTEIHAQSPLEKTPTQHRVKQEVVHHKLVPAVTKTRQHLNTSAQCSQPQQVANLLCAQANSASYPQRDGK